MITATLFVYGHGKQVNWSDWQFLQLPVPGDLVQVKDANGDIHYAKVRHTEYAISSVHRNDAPSSAIVITDWQSTYLGGR